MKVREVRNNSAGTIQLILEDGRIEDLRPGCSVSNIRVNESELKRVRPLAEVKLDLSEVKGLLD